MTKKHFEQIAKNIQRELKFAQNDDEKAGVRKLAQELSRTFKGFNPNFDRERFLSACGI